MSDFDPLWFRIFSGLIVGLVLGSFTTMLCYRVPRRISIVSPPSHCPNCKTRLKPRDLVPVLSWLIGKGRCRHCHAKISPRYLIVELATTALCVAAFAVLGLQLALVPALIGIVAFVTLATVNAMDN